jgi:fluoroacetyl-CoA thioesterase
MRFRVRTAQGSQRVFAQRHQQGTAEATYLRAEDGFPAVLVTSRMVELMELAASRLMKTRLREGESSLGIEMNVTHAVPATVGGTLRAVATYDGISGRVHRFTINVFDATGLIGSARHARAAVAERKLLAMERRKVAKPDLPLMV